MRGPKSEHVTMCKMLSLIATNPNRPGLRASSLPRSIHIQKLRENSDGRLAANVDFLEHADDQCGEELDV